MPLLIVNFLLLVLYMSGWYVVGRTQSRLDVADTAWGGGFILVAISSAIFKPSAVTLLLLICTLVWGGRLAWHIWNRNTLKGPDPRYDALSEQWSRKRFWLRAYFSIFMVQAFLIFLVSLPISLSALADSPPNVIVVTVGATVWLIGIIIEAMADRQLKEFVSNPVTRGGVLQSGLWKYSRHPNYFGEILLWWGVAIIALGAHASWLLLFGPITISILLLFVSGIPAVERRYKSNPAYQEYAHRTSRLIPLPPRSS